MSTPMYSEYNYVTFRCADEVRPPNKQQQRRDSARRWSCFSQRRAPGDRGDEDHAAWTSTCFRTSAACRAARKSTEHEAAAAHNDRGLQTNSFVTPQCTDQALAYCARWKDQTGAISDACFGDLSSCERVVAGYAAEGVTIGDCQESSP
jgi:hypothetical protein